MTFIYYPKSFTWDECYVINEIIEKYDFPTYDFEFDVLDQYTMPRSRVAAAIMYD